jgi:hypothetical protein
MAEETRPFELAQEFSNPYKQTQLFIDDGRAFFGLQRPPVVELDGDEERIAIPMGFEGHLDIIAQTTLGDRQFWRVIAQVNRIDFPLEEVKVGDRIIIPKLEKVRAAYRAAIGRAAEL